MVHIRNILKDIEIFFEDYLLHITHKIIDAIRSSMLSISHFGKKNVESCTRYVIVYLKCEIMNRTNCNHIAYDNVQVPFNERKDIVSLNSWFTNFQIYKIWIFFFKDWYNIFDSKYHWWHKLQNFDNISVTLYHFRNHAI